jgi:alginate O-acetyltransferase complex protein AlgI
MFGFRFPENFRWPYIAVSMQDFWRRWHMTLSAWFRDYLYVPLGGNRVAPRRLYINLVTVFFLCGLWHGANWTFVLWGLIHGLFLVIERLGLGKRLEALPAPLRHAYVLAVTMVAWVFFRADTLSGAVGMLRALVGLSAAAPTVYAPAWYLTPELMLAMAAGIVGATPVVHVLADVQWSGMRRLQPAFVSVTLIALFVASVMLVAARTYNPFIYFRF